MTTEYSFSAVEQEDYKEIGNLIVKSFHLNHYFSDDNTLQLIEKQYVYSCLLEATYTKVVKKDNRVIGVIMGNAKKQYKVFSHLSYLIKMLCAQSKLIKIRKQPGLRDFRNIHKIYAQFLKRHPHTFDGVLTLFAVDDSCQGKGIGKQLLEKLLAYYQAAKVKCIYLFTDSNCNYGFYEHCGFTRLEEEPLLLSDNTTLDIYLYGYEIEKTNNPM